MTSARLLIAILSGAFLLGCSNTTPQVGLLSHISGDIEFSPALITTADWSSVPVSGICSAFVDAVTVSFDGGQNWLAPQSLDPAASTDCSSGKFTLTLSNTRSPLNGFSFVSGGITEVQFRTHMKFGTENTSLLRIQYTPTSYKPQEILIGSQTQSDSGNTLLLQGRARSQKQTLATGGTYKLRGWIR